MIFITSKPGLYRAPYGPDPNPIENAFSKVKAILRKAVAHTLEEQWAAVAAALDASYTRRMHQLLRRLRE